MLCRPHTGRKSFLPPGFAAKEAPAARHNAVSMTHSICNISWNCFDILQRVEATVLNSLLPISIQEICYVLPDLSPTTVEAALAALVRGGAVAKTGAGKNTKYVRRGGG